jgi:lipopolysaccharide biosynthesis glycosyltransferase
MKNKKIIPIFYASDENYMPYLAVALASLKANKSEEFDYRIHVLYTGALNGYATKVEKMAENNLSIEFIDVSGEIDRIKDCMICRDYYTTAIYYRLLIPELFPQYDKALYMDCDTVALTDVAQLYNIDIADNYIGAVADQAVAAVPQFCEYTKNALGIDGGRYFNSGVIVMNLKKFREFDFYGKFCDLLSKYKFTVAQDQDYLNVVCRGLVKYLGEEWNRMPIEGEGKPEPKLVHYNLTMKPWRYENILYKEYFWSVAEKNEYYDEIKDFLNSFTEEMAKNDLETEAKLRKKCPLWRPERA